MSQLPKTKNYHESTKIGKHEKGQRGSVFVIRGGPKKIQTMKRIQHFIAWIKASGRKRETKFSLLYYVNRDID
jgi:hypothetical protein